MSKKRRQSKRKQQEQAKKRLQWEREDKQIKEFRAKAPYFKTILRGRGCVLPFYDFLDSYSDEFRRIAEAAKSEHSSLLGIHEVDDQTYFESDVDWSKLGYGDLQQVFFEIDDEVPGYGRKGTDANMCGFMSAFLDENQNVRTVILIRQTVKVSFRHRELKYAFKIASLLHEIGHVNDLENGINFDMPAKRLNLIDAEVYANLFCLDQLARRNLVQSFNMLESGLRDAIPQDGYLSEVAGKVLERLPQYQLTDWNTALSEPPTQEELRILGPNGIRAISG